MNVQDPASLAALVPGAVAGPPAAGDAVAVLGAGPGGLVAASLLARAGHAVLVIDRASRLGGAHRSHAIGPYTFDAGSIFYEERSRFLLAFDGLAELCRPVRRVQRRVAPDGRVLGYPIEPRDLLSWPRGQLARAVLGLLAAQARPGLPRSLDEACRARLGPPFYHGTGLRTYVERFHHEPPETIDPEFFASRMGFIERATRPRAMVASAWRAARRRPFSLGPPVGLVARPAQGIEVLFDRARAELEGRGARFALGESLVRLTAEGPGFVVETDRARHRVRAVVSAIPLEDAHKAALGTGSGLRSLDLLTLFVSVGRADPGLGTVLFNFHPRGRWKRITFYSRLYPEMGAGREFFSAEVTLADGQAPDPEAAFADLSGHLAELGIMSPDLVLEGHDVIEAAYPLLRVGDPARAAAALGRLAATGVICAGRQGRFEYLPTASGVARQVGEELARAGLAGAVAAAPSPQDQRAAS